MTNFFKLFFFLYLLIHVSLFSQIRVVEFPASNVEKIDSVFFNVNDYRTIINLNQGWSVYLESSPNQIIDANLPLIFTETESLVFTKKLETPSSLVGNYDLVLTALGINYSAEILLNDVVVFKNDVANIPIKIELNSELLKTTELNTITIRVRHQLDSENTIPVYQRFLFPQNIGGITRDVYIEVLPKNRITNLNVQPEYKLSKVKISFSNHVGINDTSNAIYSYTVNISDKYGNKIFNSERINIVTNTQTNKEFIVPALPAWSPESPNYFIVTVDLFKDNTRVDQISEYHSNYALANTDDGISLNSKNYELNGVTYFTPEYDVKNENIYKILETDLKLIKEMGVNSVRFSKHIPHPYSLIICQRLGLFAFIEMPLNSIPDEIIEKENFRYRSTNTLYKLLENYSQFDAVAAIGVGGGYLSNSAIEENFISHFGAKVKAKTNKLAYASFWDVPRRKYDNIDLYGIELHDGDLESTFQMINETGKIVENYKLFISEATYPNYNSNSSGYLVDFSNEAQAKYFEDVVNLTHENNLSGLFFNSMYDYTGDFPPFFSSYNSENNYNIGILENKNKLESISFKVIHSKVTKSERVTIPIGSKSEDSILFFIFTGLGLAILLGILINSKKKFREDATRALLRPYNFFADIRDHRILSGFHTFALMLIISGAHALLVTNVLYYLKNKIFFEKILLSLGSNSLMELISYLAWHPEIALVVLFIFSILVFALLALIIKLASFTIKTKVLFSSIYFVVIWAFLPMAILLPVKLILYKVLVADLINLYIFAFLLLYMFWILQRILKGIYVIFDVNKSRVYIYSYLVIVVLAGLFILYFQLKYSALYYILNSLRQFHII